MAGVGSGNPCGFPWSKYLLLYRLEDNKRPQTQFKTSKRFPEQSINRITKKWEILSQGNKREKQDHCGH